MTFTQQSAAMRRLADAIDRAVASQSHDAETGKPTPVFENDAAVGAASMLCYLRDLVTTSDRDVYDRPTLLVMLEMISRDPELFPSGVGSIMWQAEENDDD